MRSLIHIDIDFVCFLAEVSLLCLHLLLTTYNSEEQATCVQCS